MNMTIYEVKEKFSEDGNFCGSRETSMGTFRNEIDALNRIVERLQYWEMQTYSKHKFSEYEKQRIRDKAKNGNWMSGPYCQVKLTTAEIDIENYLSMLSEDELKAELNRRANK